VGLYDVLMKIRPSPVVALNRCVAIAHDQGPAKGLEAVRAIEDAGRLGEIHVPTLIVVGASDIPDVHAQAGVLEAGIHGARRVVFPGAGHLVQLDQPEALDRKILLFLRPDEVARRERRHPPVLPADVAALSHGAYDVHRFPLLRELLPPYLVACSS